MMFVYIFLAVICSVYCGVTKDVEEKAGCGGDLNAEFRICPPLPACQLTCDGQRDDCSPGCMEPGCVCKSGFVFNEKYGKCTSPWDCPDGCRGDPNSVYILCPERCGTFCENPRDIYCVGDCIRPGCLCKSGFYLNEQYGNCTTRWDCPDRECEDKNAVYKRCPTRCDPTCYTKDTSSWCSEDTEACEPPGCRCKEGFYFDELSSKCMEPDECPEWPWPWMTQSN